MNYSRRHVGKTVSLSTLALFLHSITTSLKNPSADRPPWLATDLSTGKAAVIQSGRLSKAIHASSAIPGLFESVEFQNKILVDGSVSCPVPVGVARKMGATFIIAVNLETYLMRAPKPGISSVSLAAINMLQTNLAKEQSKTADITITPEVTSVSSINLTKFVGGADIVQKGYEATIKLMPLISKKLQVNL